MENPFKRCRFFGARLQGFTQAGCAKDFIRMFGNALPAEKSAALGTAGHRFARFMLLTALMREV